MLTPEILELDETLHAVAHEIDTNLINPTNGEHIKRTYDGSEPVFLYAQRPDVSAVQQRLRSLQFPKTPEGELLRKKCTYLRDKLALITAIGTPEFTAISKRLHPPPSKQLVQQARDILAQKSDTPAEKVRLMDAYGELQDTIEALGIPWRVQKINMLASASVMPSQQLLYLKRKTLFSRRFIERLKIHEIGTHAVRAENGREQPLKIFLHGFADYLSTEEGLAVYNEERFGLLDDTVLRTYAGRVLAVHLSATHTFARVVEELQKYFSQKRALTIALRAKRGVASGNELGGYTKDVVYLRGYRALKEYEAVGGDFTPLYYGKVGLDDLPLLAKLSWLKKPTYFPEMVPLHTAVHTSNK